jgi:hypothetical protein
MRRRTTKQRLWLLFSSLKLCYTFSTIPALLSRVPSLVFPIFWRVLAISFVSCFSVSFCFEDLLFRKRKMSGRGAKAKKKAVSKSARAGLQFPVGRLARYLKNGRYAQRVGAGAPVYLAAVLEYLAAEVAFIIFV